MGLLRIPQVNRAGQCMLTCLFYGLIAAGAAAQEVEEEKAAPLGREIRIMGYNVHGYRLKTYTGDTGAVTNAKPQVEIDALLQVLTAVKPDVLGISEMGEANDLEDLKLRLKARGLELPYAEWVGGQDAARHVALLSRFPIIRRHSQQDPRYRLAGIERSMHRGILDVVVDCGQDISLRLMGVHLKSQRDSAEADQALVRRHEAHLLRRYVDKALTPDPSIALVVFGDFNESRDQPGVREIEGTDHQHLPLQMAPLQDSRGQRWTYWFRPADLYQRIDYLFLNRTAGAALVAEKSGVYDGAGWDLASDHRPLYLTLNRSLLRKALKVPGK